MNADFEIREVPLYIKADNEAVDRLLAANDLRREHFDFYVGAYSAEGELVGGAGLDLANGIMKCVAICDVCRGEGIANALVGRIRAEAASRGIGNLFVYTKPEYESLFSDLAFSTVGRHSKVVLMESRRRGIKDYVASLAPMRKEGRTGAIVMNANPLTIGHRQLIARAASEVDWLYLFLVSEDKSAFSFAMRRAMAEEVLGDYSNVTLVPTDKYAVSSSTFPSYFLKAADNTTYISIALDLDIFCRHIAPALGISIRYAGSEPTDALTARYNELMAEILPPRGLEFRVIERFSAGGRAISATDVRRLLAEGEWQRASALMAANSAWALAYVARAALIRELNLTPKPGLVDMADNGSHTDMDHALMMKSIESLTLSFRHLLALGATDFEALRKEAIEAERRMFEATGGVNTHKGALFSFTIALCAATALVDRGKSLTPDNLSKEISTLASCHPAAEATNGARMVRRHNAKGALANAQDGYSRLFGSWLPYLRAHRAELDVDLRLLLLIISELDDTNVLHRVGAEGAEWLREEASKLLATFTEQGMKALNRECIARNISPGGAADMLSLTFLIDNLTSE